MRGRLLTIVILFFVLGLRAQFIYSGDTLFNSNFNFHSINSINWSADSDKLVFNAKHSDSSNHDIYIFNVLDTSMINLTTSKFDENNVCWHPDGKHIIYDNLIDTVLRLMIIDINTFVSKPLINRSIQNKEGSFSKDSILVAFSGYDIIDDVWQIYSYDFVYDNLNQLTDNEFNSVKPVFSPDGKHIIYQEIDTSDNTVIKMINWYGNAELEIDTINAHNFSWNPDSWRFTYIADAKEGDEVFSLRTNGLSPLQLTFNTLNEKFYVVSPNGSLVAIVITNGETDELLILEMKN